MARRGTRRSEQDEKVIDPFNAPDPIMPHDEPDLAGVYDPIVSPDEDTDNAFRSSKDRTVGTKKIRTPGMILHIPRLPMKRQKFKKRPLPNLYLDVVTVKGMQILLLCHNIGEKQPTAS